MQGTMKSPCYKCEERHIGCHGKCEKYAAFKADLEKQKQDEAAANGMLSCSRHKSELLKKRRGEK